MKKLIVLCLLLVTMFYGCDDKDYPPYSVEVEIEGEGKVSGQGSYGFAKDCNLKAIEVKESGYFFTGWYSGDKLLSRYPEYTYKDNSDIIIKAVFSNNVYSIKLMYVQKFQKQFYVVKGDEIYVNATSLPDWNPSYAFRGWEARDSDTGTLFKKERNSQWKFIPEQNLTLYTDWDMN